MLRGFVPFFNFHLRKRVAEAGEKPDAREPQRTAQPEEPVYIYNLAPSPKGTRRAPEANERKAESGHLPIVEYSMGMAYGKRTKIVSVGGKPGSVLGQGTASRFPINNHESILRRKPQLQPARPISNILETDACFRIGPTGTACSADCSCAPLVKQQTSTQKRSACGVAAY